MCLACAGRLLTEVIGLHGKIIALNLISFMESKKKKKDFGSGKMYKCPSPSGSASFEKQKQLQGHSSQTDLVLRSKIRIELGTTPRTLSPITLKRPCEGDSEVPLIEVLYYNSPNMCPGGCAKCLGGTLIPLALFGFLANILLFFPGGKVIDNKDHLSDEVWFFGGILGSGVLVSRDALKSCQRFLQNPFKIGYFSNKKIFSY